jgi:hypothetical protein
MSWIEPKTNWTDQYDDSGRFIGTYVNYQDYNRIKNNLLVLHDLAIQIYHDIPDFNLGADKHAINRNSPDYNNDNFFADEFNAIENCVYEIDKKMTFIDFGSKKTFYDNGKFINATELNRLETAEKRMYDILTNAINGKLTLPFTLGIQENDLRP